ncbi:hypothetical protein DPMN_086501 [Dreissena polymorpha]|uniref:Uncharacterized protein n=1 Tax=Dreissena polymorpha TaxID=45954 RepID=A0A9D4QW13_DREPO|nr:hypothetical protein DPMN_086501 [Dreissena polymorpha]
MARLAFDITAHLGNAADANGTEVFKLFHSGMCSSDLKSIMESLQNQILVQDSSYLQLHLELGYTF